MPRYSVLLEATGKELPMLNKQQADNYAIFLSQVNPVGSHGKVIESAMAEQQFNEALIQTLAAMLGKEQHDHNEHMAQLNNERFLLDSSVELLRSLSTRGLSQKWRSRITNTIGLYEALRAPHDEAEQA